MKIEVSPSIVDIEALHQLVKASFAYMDSRIDPPSSIHQMTVESFAQKVIDEVLITVSLDDAVVGCVFCRPQAGWLYVGKMAVAQDMRGRGIGRAMMDQAQGLARDHGLEGLELETRIELTENHETFAAMGFVQVAETAHAGYGRPTGITMRCRL